ncbi:hypothetical protein ACFV1G_08080 [Streptomyces anulatus]|uniref:hypothetical protein n=1 Tax=Streptomyces anulatus TaxID=1892 RepID=UPI0036A05E6D
MNAKRVSAAAGVILAAQKQRVTAAGIAAALEAAGLLQSPESAAELVALREELSAYEVMNPQQCPAGKHADWLVDSEYTHACPWCRVAELEALTPAQFQDCQTCGAGYEYGQPCQQCEFRTQMAAELAKAPAEDPHDSPLHHTYALGRDLPEVPEPSRGHCGYDDYHDGHEWADRPHVWCPGHTYADDDEAVSS